MKTDREKFLILMDLLFEKNKRNLVEAAKRKINPICLSCPHLKIDGSYYDEIEAPDCNVNGKIDNKRYSIYQHHNDIIELEESITLRCKKYNHSKRFEPVNVSYFDPDEVIDDICSSAEVGPYCPDYIPEYLRNKIKLDYDDRIPDDGGMHRLINGCEHFWSKTSGATGAINTGVSAWKTSHIAGLYQELPLSLLSNWIPSKRRVALGLIKEGLFFVDNDTENLWEEDGQVERLTGISFAFSTAVKYILPHLTGNRYFTPKLASSLNSVRDISELFRARTALIGMAKIYYEDNGKYVELINKLKHASEYVHNKDPSTGKCHIIGSRMEINHSEYIRFVLGALELITKAISKLPKKWALERIKSTSDAFLIKSCLPANSVEYNELSVYGTLFKERYDEELYKYFSFVYRKEHRSPEYNSDFGVLESFSSSFS